MLYKSLYASGIKRKISSSFDAIGAIKIVKGHRRGVWDHFDYQFFA